MKKPVVAFSLALALVGAFAFAAAHHGPDTVTIDAAKAKKSAVAFPHAAHVKTLGEGTCDTCHHTQKGLKSDEGTKVEKCSSCHLEPQGDKIGTMKDMSLTKNPLHVNCIGCHKEKKAGPTACAKCHPA